MTTNHKFNDYNKSFSLPEYIIDRQGLKVYTASFETWYINSPGQQNTINLKRIANPWLRYVTARFTIHLLEKTSPSYSLTTFDQIALSLKKIGLSQDNNAQLYPEDYEPLLLDGIQNLIISLRTSNKLDQFYEPSKWYQWCAQNFSDYGFDPTYAVALSRIKLPGSPHGEAVKNLDPTEGPLHLTLEEPLVRRALLHDNSGNFSHQQERLAVALCLAFGRNPLNYALLRESDFFNAHESFPEAKPLWQLNIPRIKKGKGPRELFKTETLNESLALMIIEMIAANAKYTTTIDSISHPQPLFRRLEPNATVLATDSASYAFHFTSAQIGILIKNWAARMTIISPVTNNLLNLTPRRLRYTLATNMARQGASKKVLAEILDHTDTQHVKVYFDIFDELSTMLDKAMAKKVSQVLPWFEGKIISSDDDAINGNNPSKHLSFYSDEEDIEPVEIGVCDKTEICELDPPYSCYLCHKFRPYKFSDHERVLDLLISSREKRLKHYENSRLGIQLDDVIFAVAAVINACNSQ